MYIKALREERKFKYIIDWFKYKIQFKKDHPLYFVPCGTCIFCGPQGSGKTLSAVNYVTKLLKEFPHAILCTNVELRDYPFNAHMEDTKIIDNDTGLVISTDSILAHEFNHVCVEYDGLSCLKNISHGEYGVIYLIDELHLELNSLESSNIDIDVMVEISQQRKQRKHIVGTSQVFMRLAKPVREQIKDIILCKCFFQFLQFNKLIDGESAVEEGGKLHADVKHRSFYFHSPDMYSRYDTYAKMKRYSKEWQGHLREPVSFFPPTLQQLNFKKE